MKYQITNQKELRKAFWREHPTLSRKKIIMGEHETHVCDTRCAFVDYVDHLSKSGMISPDLAQRVTLG